MASSFGIAKLTAAGVAGLLTLACGAGARSHSASPAPAPAPAPAQAAASEPGRPDTLATCSALEAYAEAAQALTRFSHFGPDAVVLLRPSEDAPRIERGAAALARADADAPDRSALVREVSGRLRAQLASLRRLLMLLEKRDARGYLEESTRYQAGFVHVTQLGRGIEASCGKRLLPSGVGGRLRPAVIQNVVRSRFGELRKCYEAGLARNAQLAGRVTVRFVINREGLVEEARDVTEVSSPDLTPEPETELFFVQLGVQKREASSTPATTLPDPEVIACLVDRYRTLRFPAPHGGTVTVIYPVQFSPDDSAE